MMLVQDYRFKHRNDKFLQGFNEEEMKIKHENFNVELRRNKRVEKMMKKRKIISENAADKEQENLYRSVSQDLQSYSAGLSDRNLSDFDKLSRLTEIIHSDPPMNVLAAALTAIRIMISVDSPPDMGILIHLDFPLKCISLLDYSNGAAVVSEAAWTICNMVSGKHEYAEVLVNLSVIQRLIRIISPDYPLVCEHAVWAISNLCGDCIEFAEEVLENGYLEKIMKIKHIWTSQNMELASLINWSIHNISLRAKDLNPIGIINVIEIVKELIVIDNLQIFHSCLCVLSNIANLDNEKIQLIVDNEFHIYGFEGLKSNQNCIIYDSLKFLGIICSGNHDQTQVIIDLGILDIIETLIDNECNQIDDEIYFTLANIAAGNSSQLELLQNHRIFKRAIKGLAHNSPKSRKEASFLFSNFCKQAKNFNKLELVELNIFSSLSQALDFNDPDITNNCLDIIYRIFTAWNAEKYYINYDIKDLFISAGCLAKLEALTNHMNENISAMSLHIIKEIFENNEPEIVFEGDSVFDDVIN
ncbi:unnamed protein product [Blepharisma stoltei]|uniref:Importin subunit alpha n=1 Tax=Blepharisma stoltei TaxID=1481888 RepID=A0AAU9J3U3_9CILI|nr:unnamed protein product [Blepharisma stoltei]